MRTSKILTFKCYSLEGLCSTKSTFSESARHDTVDLVSINVVAAVLKNLSLIEEEIDGRVKEVTFIL